MGHPDVSSKTDASTKWKQESPVTRGKLKEMSKEEKNEYKRGNVLQPTKKPSAIEKKQPPLEQVTPIADPGFDEGLTETTATTTKKQKQLFAANAPSDQANKKRKSSPVKNVLKQSQSPVTPAVFFAPEETGFTEKVSNVTALATSAGPKKSKAALFQQNSGKSDEISLDTKKQEEHSFGSQQSVLTESYLSQKSQQVQIFYSNVISDMNKKGANSPYAALSPAEVMTGATYCRRNMFRRAKFATDNLIAALASDAMTAMHIKSERDRTEKLVSASNLVKASINARRAYATKQITSELRSK